MKLKILWPGKTRNENIKGLQDYYLKKIAQMYKCDVFETKEAKGIDEKYFEKIKKIEANSLEKHMKDDYIIGLTEKGKTMNSEELAKLLNNIALNTGKTITFVVGGFLGLEERILKRADALLSLSKMTFSHELSRVLLLEQIYRAAMIIKGRPYAK